RNETALLIVQAQPQHCGGTYAELLRRGQVVSVVPEKLGTGVSQVCVDFGLVAGVVVAHLPSLAARRARPCSMTSSSHGPGGCQGFRVGDDDVPALSRTRERRAVF